MTIFYYNFDSWPGDRFTKVIVNRKSKITLINTNSQIFNVIQRNLHNQGKENFLIIEQISQLEPP
jgi:hypothetical protein